MYHKLLLLACSLKIYMHNIQINLVTTLMSLFLMQNSFLSVSSTKHFFTTFNRNNIKFPLMVVFDVHPWYGYFLWAVFSASHSNFSTREVSLFTINSQLNFVWTFPKQMQVIYNETTNGTCAVYTFTHIDTLIVCWVE